MEHTIATLTEGSDRPSRIRRAFVRLLLFVALPALAIGWGRSISDRASLEQHLEHLQHQMDLRLDRLGPFVDDGYDLHQRLTSLCRTAESEADPVSALRRELPQFNRKFGGMFRFFVWDEHGEIIKELTDQIGYRYVLRQLWETLQEVVRSHTSSFPQPPLSLEIVQRNSTLLRSFIGPFLAMNHLTRPITEGELHPMPLSHSRADHSRFWYRVGSRFSIFCLIGQEPFRHFRSLREAVERHNTSSKDSFQLGLFHELSRRFEIPGGKLSHPTETRRGLRRLQQRLSGRLKSDNLYLTWRNLDIGLWGVAIADLESYQQRCRLMTTRWVAAAATIGFLLWLAISGTGWQLGASVRRRVIVLFLLANGLPLLTLWAWSSDYQQQKEKALITEAFIEGEKTLRTFDASLQIVLQSLERKTNHLLQNVRASYTVPLATDSMQEIRHIFSTIRADQLYVIASTSGDLIDRIGVSSDTRLQSVEAMGVAFAFSTLLAANHGSRIPSLSPQAQRRLQYQGIRIDASTSSIEQVGQLLPLNLLGVNRYAIMVPLFRLASSYTDYLTVFLWNFRSCIELFLSEMLLPMNRRESGMRMVVYENSTGAFHTSGPTLTPTLQEFLRRTISRDHLFSDILQLNEGTYLAAGLPAQSLTGFTLCVLLPFDRISAQLAQTRFWLNFLLLANVLLSLLLSVLIARRFLGPVARLSEAITLAQQRKTAERVEFQAADELGQLSQAFNHALDNFEELNLGRIVQEQLFPADSLDNGGFRLFGRSVAMTDLGGDFFDLIPLNNQRTAVIFGDVAGHGVPAALVMAMAKAFFHRRRDDEFLPSRLINDFSSLLYSLKTGTSRRMMTMLIAILDGQTGRVDIVNAGQTFPLLISADGASPRFLEIPGVPAGTVKKLRLGEISVMMEPGDTLVFYTDGLVEARNQADQEFDYAGVMRTAERQRGKSPEEFYKAYRSAYVEHLQGRTAQDDFTMVLAQRVDRSRRGTDAP